VLDVFGNCIDERIAEITFGESVNPQHAYFGLADNNELTTLPQTVFVFNRDAQRAFSLAKGQA
jgi:tRNA (guanine-N7-)-methyltransferase